MRPRLLLAVVAVAIALLIVTRGVLPFLLEDQLTDLAHDAGLDLSLRDLTLSLISGTVSLTGISIAELDSRDEPFFVAERASVELHWIPLLDSRIHLAHAKLSRGRFLGTIDDEGVRIPGQSDTTPGLAEAEPEADALEPEASEAWPFLLDLAAIDSLEVELTLADGTQLDATISVSVEQFATEPPDAEDGRFPVSATIEIANGRIDFEGTATAAAAVKGDIQLRDLAIPTLAGLALPALDPWWTDGTLDGDIAIDFTGEAAITASGELRAHTIALRAPSGEGLSVEIQELTLPLDHLEIDDAVVVRIGTLSVEQPKLAIRNPDPELEALTASLASSEKTPAEPATPADIQIREIRATDGTVHLTLTEYEAFELALAELEIKIEALVPATGAMKQLSIGGVIDGHAPLHIEGELPDGRNGSFTGVVQQIDLETFDPLVAGIGYRLEGGTASVDTTVTLGATTTDLENQIKLHQLDLSAEDDGFQATFGLPLDAAIALMTDLEGAIHLTVPVVITDSGSEIALGGILRGALQEAILGALASPLKIVGGIASFVAGDSDTATSGANEVAMGAGKVEILPEGEKRIEAWAKLLSERPRLGVEIRGVADPSEGDAAFAEQRAALVRDRLSDLVEDGAERISIGAAQIAISEPADLESASADAVRVGARLRVDIAR